MKHYLNSKDLKSVHKWVNYLKENQIQEQKKIDVKDLNLTYPLLNQGKHRIVFDLRNGLILKVGKSLRAIDHNDKEAKLYQNVPSSLQKHLCPVVEHGNGWLIMVKMDKVVPQKDSFLRELLKINEKFLEHNIKLYDLTSNKKTEIKNKNLRLNNNKEIVIIDYGKYSIKK